MNETRNLKEAFSSLSRAMEAAQLIDHEFYLPPATVLEYTDTYYLLHWSAGYLKEQILASTPADSTYDLLSHQDKTYRVVYQKTVSSFSLLQASPKDQYKLSFRRMIGDIDGVVLIRPLAPTQQVTGN